MYSVNSNHVHKNEFYLVEYKIVPTKCTAFEGAYAAEPASSVSNVLLWTRDKYL